MAIPSWDDLDRPILELLADGEPHQVRDLVDSARDKLGDAILVTWGFAHG